MTVKLQTLDLTHDHYIHDVDEVTDTGSELWLNAKIKDVRITTVIKKKDFYSTIYEG